MRAINIDWETDGETADELGLPFEAGIPDGIAEDDVTDYLSDTFGFLVKTYSLNREDDQDDL